MGTMQHKYTREYFTGHNTDGERLAYGVEGYTSFLEGQVRDQDLSIVERIDFNEKKVLEFGFGRGEIIKYAIEHGATHYEGVDFSESAHAIAKQFLSQHDIAVPFLHNQDALEFARQLQCEQGEEFDIILMLDFVEHVERKELAELLSLLQRSIKPSTIIAINTPVFLQDHDLFVDGLDMVNNDLADHFEETAGMHCNKYTLPSLKFFMKNCGFAPISEAHFYVPLNLLQCKFCKEHRAFSILWDEAKELGVPVKEYTDDVIEYAYQQIPLLSPYCFMSGRMIGLKLRLHEDYVVNFQNGTHDEEMFSFISKLDKKPNIIFDVGGFMGVSSLLFARAVGPEGKVFCFEPNPWNLIRIQTNLSYNYEEASKVTIFPYAFGREEGVSTFLASSNIDTGYSSTSRLPNSHVAHTEQELEKMGFVHTNIEMTTIDNFISTTKIYPDVIKIDVEGYEHFLLEGAIETLQHISPILLIELHSPFCSMKCTSLLEKIGYTIVVLNEEEDGRLIIAAYKKANSNINEIQINSNYDETVTMLSRYKNALKYQTKLIEDYAIGDTVFKSKIAEQQKCIKDQQNLLMQTQAQLASTELQLADANRVLSHPVIRAQRKLWRMIKSRT